MHGLAQRKKRRREVWSTKRRKGWLEDIRAQADVLRKAAFRKTRPVPALTRTNIGVVRMQRNVLFRMLARRAELTQSRVSSVT